MSFRSTPLFSGDLYDTAWRLAGSPGASRAPGVGHVHASEKWQQMIGLGWQAVLVSEEDGGVGASLQDLAAIIEAVASQGQAVPLPDRCAVAPMLLTAARAHPQAAVLLEALAQGTVSVATALQGDVPTRGRMQTPALGADGVLIGALSAVDLSEPASHVCFQVHDVVTQTPVLVLLPWARLADVARHHVGVDERQYADMALDGLQLTSEDVLLTGAAAAQAAERASQVGSLLTCVQAVGAAAAMIELTIDYLNTRVQFGVALSSFQALRHRAVEMYVAYENLSGLVSRLVKKIDEYAEPTDRRDIVLAKMYALDVTRMVAESAIQLHGGMGMTREMLVARLAMQSMTGGQQYGDRDECLNWLTAQALAEVV